EVLNPEYLQQAAIPLTSETHGGEDVPIFATGPNADLIRGSMEESWIFYVMADAFGIKLQ
ncbi:MAG TPA: alkaline phosphatase, partial [Pyrinomonadaceae bacterium]|nr:alkaline phosphatase [Pyrinomonadaceae bacterium]